jgi:hypothetical protein
MARRVTLGSSVDTLPHTFSLAFLLLNTGTVRDVLQHNGFRGLYRGLGPTILGYLPTWAIYFAVYDGIKVRFGEPLLVEDSREDERLYPAPSAKGYQPVMREHPSALHTLSAMTAGATSTICTNPLWVIKTRFMVRLFPQWQLHDVHNVRLDPTTPRTKISPFLRRRSDHLSYRGHFRLLPRSFAQPFGHRPCRRAVSAIREAQAICPCVVINRISACSNHSHAFREP